MKPSELFEGENSSLRKTFDEATKLSMTNNTPSQPKTDLEKKQEGMWCDFCGKKHPGRCEKTANKRNAYGKTITTE